MKQIIAILLILMMAVGMCAYAESETAPVVDELVLATTEPQATAVPEDEPEATIEKEDTELTTDEPEETVIPEETAVPGPLTGITIGIDPGHQEHQNSEKELVSPKGKEKKAKVSSGTTGRKTKIPEYQTNLTVSLQLRDALEAEGATVVMTRDTNQINISNLERAMLMNDAQADLVLRIHCNGNTKKSVNGTTMFVRKSIAYGKDIVPDPKGLLQAETEAAKILVDAMCAQTGAKNCGVYKRDTYTMNNWSTVPIILVEMGYMSNEKEDVNLNDPEYQALLVRGMVNGIKEYFNR